MTTHFRLYVFGLTSLMIGQVDPSTKERIACMKGNQLVYIGKVTCTDKVSVPMGKH